ncbi:antibiotic biosynthesis monooxygenase family protein [Streptomyces sp. TRM49041]|uniref:antibiotic biosynthesis monooxygenase family protein n=1 Tax=Streptomyces sp. TRM49041 TaxID=2603216 RepID=UPI0011EFF740|nr:antibiotic biosynthesis monooxygenase family protein [Streptomyces sp. TRM49041]
MEPDGGEGAGAGSPVPARVRVIRYLRVREGMEGDFVTAYRGVLERAKRFPGHLGEQLCRSTDDSGQWLLTSEWESLESIRRWRADPDHTALLKPMNACLHDDRSTAVFHVMNTAAS